MTEWLHFHFSLSCIGEGNGNPLQRSCMESPRDGGAWSAAIYGVAQSRTWLKWLRGAAAAAVWKFLRSPPFVKLTNFLYDSRPTKRNNFLKSSHSYCPCIFYHTAQGKNESLYLVVPISVTTCFSICVFCTYIFPTTTGSILFVHRI